VEIALELIRELTKDESMMWVVGGGAVVSENNSRGIREPEVHNDSVTVEAENWHFHISTKDVAGIQFVETKTHGERLSYYVRFSGHNEETLLRSYFPNPYLDENYRPTPLQHDRLKVFTDMREKYEGRDGIIFVRYIPPQKA
jgi:hypothetical protein